MKKLLFLLSLLVLSVSEINAQAFEWYKTHTSANILGRSPDGVNIDSDGNSVVYANAFLDSVRIGNQLYIHNSGTGLNARYCAYIVKYDLQGALLWSKQINSAETYEINVKIDQNQNIVLAGFYKDSLSINGRIFTNPGYSVFTAKLDPAGNLLWARNATMPTTFPPVMIGQSRWMKCDLDANGNIYLVGTYYDGLAAGNLNISSGGLTSFLLKYDTNGNAQWLKNLSAGMGTEIAVTDAGEIYVSPAIYTPTAGSLLKFNTLGVLEWTRNTPRAASTGYFVSLGTDKSGNAYVAGSYGQQTTLGTFNLPAVTRAPFYPSYYVAKINKTGIWQWVKDIETDLTTLSAEICLPKKIYKSFVVAGQFTSPMLSPTPLVLGDSSFTVGPTFLAKFDTVGNLLQARRFITKNGYYSQIEAISMDPAGNTYLTGKFENNLTIGNFQLTHTNIPFITNGFFKRYLTKLQNYSNSLTGIVFRDVNANGIKEPGEAPFTERILEITPGPVYVNTLPNGSYGSFMPAGSFNVSIPNPPRHYTVNPASHNVSFTGQNQTVSGKDFALQPIPNSPDVKISLTPFTAARPGFNLIYNLTFTNVGTTVLSDSLSLTFNAGLLSFDSASVLPIVQQNGKLKWTYQNLQPTEKRSINVYLHIDSTAVIGNTLQAVAFIKPLLTDLFQQDNYDSLNQIITGSFDPNDKRVSHEWLTPTQAANGEYLDYVIRFQNTGTDTAFTVVVKDQLSNKLDLRYFEVLAVSHPFTFKLLPDGNAEWRFDNILLPDSNRNEPASHGFIRYRLKPKNNLILGDEIKTGAAIHFDYNAPEFTNFATTTVSLTNGIKERTNNLPALKLYPNPANSYVIIESNLKKNSAATVSLVNMLGQTLSKVTLPANNPIHYQMPLKDLPKGVYIIQLQTEAGRQMQRLVIQ